MSFHLQKWALNHLKHFRVRWSFLLNVNEINGSVWVVQQNWFWTRDMRPQPSHKDGSFHMQSSQRLHSALSYLHEAHNICGNKEAQSTNMMKDACIYCFWLEITLLILWGLLSDITQICLQGYRTQQTQYMQEKVLNNAWPSRNILKNRNQQSINSIEEIHL